MDFLGACTSGKVYPEDLVSRITIGKVGHVPQ